MVDVVVPVHICGVLFGWGSVTDSHAEHGEASPYPVKVDPSPYLSMTEAARTQVEQHAIQQIVDRVPTAQRSAMLRALTDASPEALGFGGSSTIAAYQFSGSSDPVIAQWLGVIASVRAVSASRAAANFSEAPTGPSGDRVFVTVAYDAARDTASIALLRPTDAFPVLLLRREADAVELRAGLVVAAKLFKDFGAHPNREYRAAVPPNDARVAAPSNAQKLLTRIQSSTPRNLPGLGRLPAIEVAHYTRR